MKKMLLSLVLVISMLAFAAESAPSATVGYVKYTTPANNNYNFLALAVNPGYASSSNLGDAIAGCNQVSWYDEANQVWKASGKGVFGWTFPFSVYTNFPYMVYTTTAGTYINAGPVVDLVPYTLVVPTTGYNDIMHPYTKSGTLFDSSSEIGDNITTCNQVSWYDTANQVWKASGKGVFGWTFPFATEPTKPLMVNVTAGSTWPGAKYDGDDDFVKPPVDTPKGDIKNVFYAVMDNTGTPYDFTQPVVAGVCDGVKFDAFNTARPTEKLSSAHPSALFGILGPFSMIGMQIGSFASPWSAGEFMRFWVYDTATSLQGAQSGPIPLDAGGADAYYGVEAFIPGTGAPISVSGDPSSIEDSILPIETKLHQNYPNPFNPTTTIKFDIAQAGNVQLNVYNYTGQLVKSLVNGEMKAGFQSVNFDASSLSAGVYYYTLQTAGKTMTQKMVLIK
jgi:hypothetical protein